MKTAIIIGAGIGGLATAARLLSKGYKVTVYEKNNTIGGKVNYIDAGNFRFDLTASILMTPHIYQEVFDYTGKDYRDYLKFISLDPFYRAFYSDGNCFDIYSNTSKLTKNLEKISKADSIGYYKFISNVYNKYIIADKFFLNNSYTRPIDFYNFISLQKILEINPFSSSYSHISKYITDEKLRNVIAYQSLYVGISPFDGPNIYNLIPTISQLYGLWYLEGGLYSYVLALEKLINELGGKIIKNTKISKIITKNKTAIGIELDQRIEKADIVICDADFSYAMKNLIDNNKLKGKYTDKKIADMKYTCSTFIMHLGLKKKYPKLLVHNLYIGDNFKQNIQSAFIGQLPTKPSLYIYCPSRIDNTMADTNTESINIMVRVPNTLNNNIVWHDSTINLMRQRIFNELSNIEELADIKNNIIYESLTTPKDFLEKFNCYGGTAFGLSPTLSQTNYYRPHVKSPTIKNMYFVGNSVHPGTGVSIVLLSSKLAVEEIIKDNK